MSQINVEELKDLLAKGYLMVSKHPTLDLYIYNYTKSTQYERLWNETTLSCRGLVLDGDYNVVSRCMRKFFNHAELPPELIPTDKNFKVFTKEDGSMGQLFRYKGEIILTSRGSFDSEYSRRAYQIIETKYPHVFDNIREGVTYIGEIIYPENRIVCDYNGREDFILLACIDIATGKDLPLEDVGLPIVECHDGVNDFEVLQALNLTNKEGFVIKYDNGFRFKLKFEDYCRLHSIVTRVSSYDVWETLMNKGNLDEMLDRVPDEFYDWVKKTVNSLTEAFEAKKAEIDAKFWSLIDRKDFAMRVKDDPEKHLLFSRLTSVSKDYENIIWRMIKPEYSTPFKNTEEDV